MIIISATDQRFVPHFAAMLQSAWTHHPEAEFYLLDCGIEPHTLATLADYAATRRIRLSIITIDAARLHGLPTTAIWSVAIYARLLIPDLLPDTIERALYLDADCIVVGDLSELWRMNMDHAAIAGVRDRAGRHEPTEAGIDPSWYVNSGVLLMNLPLWRREHLAAAALAFVRRHKLSFPDQTAINAACADRIVFLAEKWNFMPAAMQRAYRGQPVHIVHWTAQKPWLYRDVLFGPLYLHHRNQTPFPASVPIAVYRSALRRLINLIFGSRKYWRSLISARHARAFVKSYTAAVGLQQIR